MKLTRRRKRKVDPAKNARVVVLDPDATSLDRLAAELRDAGFRVLAINRVDALVPLTRVFKPDAFVIGLDGPQMEATRIGRRLHRRYRGAVPVVYVGQVEDDSARRFVLGEGQGLALIEPAKLDELVLRLRSLLQFKAAVSDEGREAWEAQSPSLHDEVTGLYNRRILLEMVAAEARRGERYGGCFSVVIAELDDFLAFRDRHGEELCDRLMVYGGVLLRQSLRESDVLARVGRYHFGMLLPGLPSEAVPKLVARLEQRFALGRFQTEGQGIRATITVGAATFPDVVGPAQQIFARAIQSLDKARDEKHAGPPRAAV